mmetsp:Transcript_13936/g.18280  ORF Transcript_13936/g.18280 Transcript_13936/m.18280 type:complete len:430 (+) Transcript_13936:109-1398(+)
MFTTQVIVFKDYQDENNNRGIPKKGQRIAIGNEVEKTKEGSQQLLPGHAGKVTCFAWSPEGNLLLTASVLSSLDSSRAAGGGALARVWDVTSLEVVKDLVYHDTFGCPRAMQAAAWTPDAALLALGSEDYFISLWNGETFDLMRLLEGHSNSILCLSWSPNGKYLLSGADDRHLILWEKRSLVAPKQLSSETSDYDGSSHPENSDFTIREGEDYKVYECTTTVLKSMQDPVSVSSWKPSGEHFCVGSNFLQCGKLAFWDCESKTELKAIDQTEEISDLSWTSESDILAVAYRNGKIILWNSNEYNQIISITVEEETKGTPLFCWWLPGHRLLTSTGKGAIETWSEDKDLSAWCKVPELSHNCGFPITACRVHPSGYDLVLGGIAGEVSLLRLDETKSKVQWLSESADALGGDQNIFQSILQKFMCPCAV